MFVTKTEFFVVEKVSIFLFYLNINEDFYYRKKGAPTLHNG